MELAKKLCKSLLELSIIGGAMLLAVPLAEAQPAYGSYVGAGISFGVSEGNVDAGEGRTTSALVAVRYKFLEIPISLRSQILIGSSIAIVPTVSYDLPLNFNTDLYLGAGIALTNSANNTPIGNKVTFVLQPGLDYTLPDSNLVIFGNAVFALSGYSSGSGIATALQTGVGLRF